MSMRSLLRFHKAVLSLLNGSCDQPFDDISELPNVYTSYRKSVEPLRSRPRKMLSTPDKILPLPKEISPQQDPFIIPTSKSYLIDRLLRPLQSDTKYYFDLSKASPRPQTAHSGHPFDGGDTSAQNRLLHLITSGVISTYKATRNGMLGVDYSTKFSAFLSHGHMTSRQIHWAMVDFEEGRGPGKGVPGYGKGENEGTAAVRFELLWRDFMRLCNRRFGAKMFHIDGIGQVDRIPADNKLPSSQKQWKYLQSFGGNTENPGTREVFERFCAGRTGMSLIDASQRELLFTGYTSNRARQNVASYLSLHLGLDWRIGAEWYEYLLTDYDVSSNWGNWQYVSGVGNDPRVGRVFNPVKQAFDYDKKGEYIKTWIPDLRDTQLSRARKAPRLKKDCKHRTTQRGEELDRDQLMGLYQPWRLSDQEKQTLGLKGKDWVDDPLVKINFDPHRSKSGHRGGHSKRGR